MDKLLYKEESYIIRGVVFDIYKKFRNYHKEKIYRDSLLLALKDKGMRVEKEKRIDIFYNKKKVGVYVPDLVINDVIFIELKSKPIILKEDIEQFWHYLKNSNYKLGFLINFGGNNSVQIIRKVYDTARFCVFPRNIPRLSALEGAATLPTVLALTILIAALAAGLAAMTVADSLISQGAWQSSKALFYAEAGAKDALIRIARDKKYTCDTPSSGCYQIEFATNGCFANEGCAKITVSAATSPKVIVSEGRVKNNIRKVQASVTFDGSANGQIHSVSWQELTN